MASEETARKRNTEKEFEMQKIFEKKTTQSNGCTQKIANHVGNKKSNNSQSIHLHKKLFLMLKCALLLLVVVNVLGPIVVFVWPNIMSHMIFETFIFVPFKNLSEPGDFDLEHTHAFHLTHDDVKLGAWHILPSDSQLRPSQSLDEHFKVNIPADNTSPPIVVLYLHGNTNDRSTRTRIELYKRLRDFSFHVIAVDYRGFGDSTGIPTEDNVLKDALFTYEYLHGVVAKSASIFIWGHSLGTGVASNLARILTEQGKPASGIILEAPFFNIEAEIEFHPFTWLFAFNPLMLNTINSALKSIDLQFRSDLHLAKVNSKVLIIHAEDDWIIPIYEGEKLYEVTAESGKENLHFHKISREHNCGHNKIAMRYPQFEQLVKSFITTV
jgi:abhydrolase domain-containing protein 12